MTADQYNDLSNTVMAVMPANIPWTTPPWVATNDVEYAPSARETHGFWESRIVVGDITVSVSQYVREVDDHPDKVVISPAYLDGYGTFVRDGDPERNYSRAEVSDLTVALLHARDLMIRADDETKAWAVANGGEVL